MPEEKETGDGMSIVISYFCQRIGEYGTPSDRDAFPGSAMGLGGFAVQSS
jgi:hypothetical protein